MQDPEKKISCLSQQSDISVHLGPHYDIYRASPQSFEGDYVCGFLRELVVVRVL